MMAKEMLIVFLYDTEMCTKEQDDPMSALLFFAPSWVGETRHLLVGQIMGVTRFFRDNFGSTQMITLNSGKFAFRFLGRYVLVVGTDRNVDESILQYRSDLLLSLLRLYHNDFEKIKRSFPGEEAEQRKKFADKLYHIFDTYLPILQYNENIFHNIVLLDLPKSAANIYLETVQILQSCQQLTGVLGGQVLYHNKIIASQLNQSLAKMLVISDPLRLKTVDPIHVGFHVPFGVHLMSIYISSKDLQYLKNSAQNSQTSFTNTNSNLLPFTFSKRKTVNKEGGAHKREKTLIFSNIPEEDTVMSSQHKVTKSKVRPTHLALKFKNMTSKEQPESGFNSLNFDEFDSFPDLIGKTSVCSTPMAENKILHGNVLSICSKTCEELEKVDTFNGQKTNIYSGTETSANKMKNCKNTMGTPKKLKLTPKITAVINLDSELDSDGHNKGPLKNDLPIDSYNYLHNPFKENMRRNSWDTLTKIKTKLKLGKNNNSKNPKAFTPKETQGEDWDSEAEFIDDLEVKAIRSITDPTFPAFNSSGDPISKNLFEEFLEFQYTVNCTGAAKLFKKKVFTKEFFFDDLHLDTHGKYNDGEADRMVESNGSSSNPKKRNLSLPLKTWNQSSEIESKAVMFDTSNKGLPLTPLMAKLTLIALDSERESGFASCNDFTAGPIDHSVLNMKRRPSHSEQKEAAHEHLQKVNLFVCGQQNMTFIMLLEDGVAQDQKLIQTLFEICVSKLAKTEQQLHQVLNMNVEGTDKGGEGNYSFMAIDNQKWDTLQKIGPWSPNDLNTVKIMHNDMKQHHSFTEMIVRKEDNILYGFQCGNIEVFYQQSYIASAGIPPPSDVFGNVGSVSRRRLERDHAIILL